jgi:hypothetical protein
MPNQPDERAAVELPIPTQLMANAFKMNAHGDDLPGTPMTAPPVCTAPPVISGGGEVGFSLATTLGEWSESPTEFTGAWFSDATTQVGTGATYQIQPQDAGHDITCIVTATNSLGSTASPPSNAITIDVGRI